MKAGDIRNDIFEAGGSEVDTAAELVEKILAGERVYQFTFMRSESDFSEAHTEKVGIFAFSDRVTAQEAIKAAETEAGLNERRGIASLKVKQLTRWSPKVVKQRVGNWRPRLFPRRK